MASEATPKPAPPGYEAFLSSTYQRVVALVAAATGDATVAQAAVHEAYGLAVARWSTVRRMGHPDVWLARLALRIAIDALMKQPTDAANDGSPRPAPIDVRRLWARLHLEALPPPQRAKVLLGHFEGTRVDGAPQEGGHPSATFRSNRVGRRLRVLIGKGQGSDG